MAIAALVLSFVAIGVSVCALGYTRIQAHAAREQADVATRTEARDLAEAARITWDLTKGSGDSFVLRNVGRAAAVDVTAVGEDVDMRAPEGWPRIEPGASVRFVVSHSLASRSNSVEIAWTDASGRRESWVSDLP